MAPEVASGSTAEHAGTSGLTEVPVLLPMALPLMKIRFWNAPEVAPEVSPELPVNRKYRRAQRYYRWLLPEPVPLTKMGFCFFSGSCTGSDTGTTAKPEVPALPAELPPLRVFVQ